MMRGRRHGGDGRFRSPNPPPRRISLPPGRSRDRGYSLPRRYYDMDMEEGRRGGRFSRRGYDWYSEKQDDRGGKEYQRKFSCGEKLSDRDYGRYFSQGDGGNVRGYSRGGGGGGMRIPSYNGDDRSFGHGGLEMRIPTYSGDDGRSFGRGGREMRIPTYSGDDRDDGRNSSRGGREMRIPNYSGDHKEDDISFSRGGGGMRMPNYDGGDSVRDRDFGDRERDGDGGHSRSMYQSSADGEYLRSVYESSAGTSSKFQWDHLLDETRKPDGFKSSIDRGVGGSGMRNDLEYNYQSKFSDKGHGGLVFGSKPMLIEAEKGRDYPSSSYHMNVSFPTNNSSHVDDAIASGMSMSSHYTNSGPHKDEDFHKDKLHSEKLVADEPVMRNALARESYKDKPLHYSTLDTDYMLSSSQSKAFYPVPLGSFKEDISSSFRDDLGLPSDGDRMSTMMMTNSTGYNRNDEKLRSRSPMDYEGRFGDFKSYSRSYLGTAEENRRDYAYPLVGSDERGGTIRRSADKYGKILGIGEDYSRQVMSRMGILGPIGVKGDESSDQGYLKGSRLFDHHPTSLGQSSSDHYHSFHVRRKDVEGQGIGSPQPKYERESYHGPSALLKEHNNDHEVASGSLFDHRLSDISPFREYDPHFGDIDGRPQEKFVLGNMSLSKPFKSKLKRKHAEKQFSEHSNTSYGIGDAGEPCSDNVDSNIFLKRLKVNKSKYSKSRSELNMIPHHRSLSGRVSFPKGSHVPGTRDIKNRLGPVAPKVHVSQRVVMKYKPSLKKRLGPVPQKNHATLPWLKNLNCPRLPRSQDGSGGSDRNQVEDPQEDNVISAKPEPPENSEDFKQLVRIAFFKFVKQLNITSAKRRKYKEQGVAGTLKCIVCRSQEEFSGTENLATHAFMCQTVGLRSGHLGLHKALCVLMGWKDAEKTNDTWVCQMLSEAENLTLKEDLILWPPVLIIHNGTIVNKNPGQRVVVSIEELEAKLRDMGFGDKTKVFRGKAANQSVMVVEFAGRLSGLQEAERLHKVYADNNHGRAEFLQIKSCNNGGHGGETECAPLNKLEDVLYGYLGIAEDLDKLDFDAKKRRMLSCHFSTLPPARAAFRPFLSSDHRITLLSVPFSPKMTTEAPFRPREKLFEKQKYFQNIHKHTYLKGPFDKITSVAIPVALAATSVYLIGKGIYNMSHGIGKKE
ncbi:hypothetical protein ACH5RR_009739 [Cinchona calisaya]|uniref:XS domain-containing protein n=1 Tax=Cinchona calisaya TaxID=153742 RepID=A0ABD3AHZ5_9GENT